MKRLIIFVIIAVAVVIGGLTIAYLLFTGPRMFVQPNIRQFQAVMPVTPANTVPVKDIFEPLPSKSRRKNLPIRLTRMKEISQRERFITAITVFSATATKAMVWPCRATAMFQCRATCEAAKVKSMSDGEIFYSMLTGTGHAPMLQRIIPSEYWWYLVLRSPNSSNRISH